MTPKVMQDTSPVSLTREIEGVVQGTSGNYVWIDLGTDHLAVASASEFRAVSRNSKVRVYVIGADPEDLYLVSTRKPKEPKQWEDLKQAAEEKAVITGQVISFVKGGFLVDVGRPAFMPTSKSGGRDREEREGLIGRQILCTIEEFEENGQDIIVDRRSLLEAAELSGQRSALEELKEGTRVRGRICTLTDFGAFVDLGGIDGLIHVRDISWEYVQKPSDVLSLGQEVEAVVASVDAKRGRVSLSLKALKADPWAQVAAKYHAGDRVRGTVTSVNDIGAFVELEPGVEGLIHAADLSWSKTATDAITAGTTAEFYILDVDPAERRIGLARKPPGEDPWKDVKERFPVGSVVMGTITTLTSFGAFVAVGEGLEGMIHVSDISESRTEHPRDVLKEGQQVRAQVLESDASRRRLRLGIRQLAESNRLPQVESRPPVLQTEQQSSSRADFSLYSKSIFLNCSTHPPHRSATEAIVFTVIDAGLMPRLATDPRSLIAAVRECQFGIHDVSRTFELGLFLGCKEFGSDLHRMKDVLLMTSGLPHEVFGEKVHAHSNDPAEAVHHVAGWIRKMTGTGRADPARVWERYQRFQKETGVASKPSASDDVNLTKYIALASEWVAASSTH